MPKHPELKRKIMARKIKETKAKTTSKQVVWHVSDQKNTSKFYSLSEAVELTVEEME